MRAFSLAILLVIIGIFFYRCTGEKEPEPVLEEWITTTLSGNGQGYYDWRAEDSKFDFPVGLAYTPNQPLYKADLFIADFNNHVIRKISPDHYVTTFAGLSRPDYVDTLARYAHFNGPYGLAMGHNGTLYVSDQENGVIRQISNGSVSTLATGFSNPSGITIGKDGCLYIADRYNNAIKRITLDGEVSLYAGNGDHHRPGYLDGDRMEALFDEPLDITAGPDGTLYITDYANRKIRKLTTDGMVSTLGNPDEYYGQIPFYLPKGIAAGSDGSLYVVDGHCIKKVFPDGEVRMIAGLAVDAYGSGDGDQAGFNWPTEIIIAPDGSLLVSDTGNHRICKIKIID